VGLTRRDFVRCIPEKIASKKNGGADLTADTSKPICGQAGGFENGG